MKNKFIINSLLIVLFLIAPLLSLNPIYAKVDASLTARLKGKILLQVESKGEAWYINPKDSKKYSLGKPTDAFGLMKKLGVGISNVDISKIPVADASLSGEDTDGDGLSDAIEDAIGTDKTKADTDGDGYSDKNELISGYDPVKISIKLPTDINFATKQKGKILIQIQQRGEAWYVNPNNGKRYFLGRPSDAFNVMRGLAVGITNANLAKVGYLDSDTAQSSGQINIKDCGEDEECFTSAVSGCEPARLKKNADFNLGSVGNQKESSVYELRGVKDGQCLLYVKTTALGIAYSEHMKGELTATGHTLEELAGRESGVNARLQELVGRDGNCQIAQEKELNNSYYHGARDIVYKTTTYFDRHKHMGPYVCGGVYFEPIRQKSICNVLTGFTGAPANGYYTDYKSFKFVGMDQNQNLTVQVDDVSDVIEYLATKTVNGLVVKNLGWSQLGGARFIKVEFNCD